MTPEEVLEKVLAEATDGASALKILTDAGFTLEMSGEAAAPEEEMAEEEAPMPDMSSAESFTDALGMMEDE